jgi:hypothetical protein
MGVNQFGAAECTPLVLSLMQIYGQVHDDLLKVQVTSLRPTLLVASIDVSIH